MKNGFKYMCTRSIHWIYHSPVLSKLPKWEKGKKKKKKANSFTQSLSYKYHWVWEEARKAYINLTSLNALCWDSESWQLNGQGSAKKVQHSKQWSPNASTACFSVCDTEVLLLLCWINSAFVKRQVKWSKKAGYFLFPTQQRINF